MASFLDKEKNARNVLMVGGKWRLSGQSENRINHAEQTHLMTTV